MMAFQLIVDHVHLYCVYRRAHEEGGQLSLVVLLGGGR